MRGSGTRLRRLTSYLTDVEGNFEYFKRFVACSHVVGRDAATQHFVLKGSHTQFVYGGDCFDKGDDLAFSEALLQLKTDYPDRVHLILGNRDVNKMVFASYFTDRVLSMTPEEAHRYVYPYESPVQLRGVGYAAFLEANGLPPRTTMVSLLQWVLSHRMGAPDAFRFRRDELAKRRPPGAPPVTDDDVVASFLGSVRKGGVVYEYLRHGELAKVMDGVLFVHGAVGSDSMGFVPDPFAASDAIRSPTRLPGRDFMRDDRDLTAWVDAINGFARSGVAEWAAHPGYIAAKGRTGGEYLRSYAFRYTAVAYSIMVTTFVRHGQPQFTELPAVEYLAKHGVSAVLCGHQPCGDSPTLIRQPGLLVVMADNSYCAADNSRGEAVSEVLVDGDTGTIRLHGQRACGTPFDVTLDEPGSPASGVAAEVSALLGRPLGDGWWAKLPGAEGEVICQRTTDGFMSIAYETLPLPVVRERVAACARQRAPVDGEAVHRWSKEGLAYQHRLKTKRHPPVS